MSVTRWSVSIFCATGITSGDLVGGIKLNKDTFSSETLVTHKSSGLNKIIKLEEILEANNTWLIIVYTIKKQLLVPSSIG